MTTTETFTEVRPEPKRDRWGRYLLPDPETGKSRPWTRATTWAKTCSDTFGLTKWELRMAAVGLAKRPDLLAQVATVTDLDNGDAKKLLDGVCGEAKEAAGASTRRNLGTALHAMTEHIDAGRDYTVPDAQRADLDAYMTATRSLDIDPAHIERITVVPSLGVAGTFDRIVSVDDRLMVADLKTGRDVSYSMGEIAIQLALYAHGAGLWDPHAETWEPMPAVDQERALVIHLPVGEATCTIHEVDIVAGWEMAQTCGVVRDWRKRRDLSTVVAIGDTGADPAPPAEAAEPADRTEWIVGRLKAIKADHPERIDSLRLAWPTDVKRQPPWTDEQIDAISTVLHHHEDGWSDPDPKGAEPEPEVEPEPVHPRLRDIDDPDGAAPVEQTDIDALKATIAALDDNCRHTVAGWSADAKRAGRPIAQLDGMDLRRWAVMRAAIRCAHDLHDDDQPDALTRAALEIVLGEDLQPGWTTGAVLGSLTTAQADDLAEIARRFAADDQSVVADLGARIVAA